MRKLKFTFLALLATTCLAAQSAQNFWESVDEARMQLDANAEVGTLPFEYHTFALDLDVMKQELKQAPQKEMAATEKALEIDLPLADGKMMTFEIYESSVMMPKLAAKFPMIRSYQGVGKNNPAYTLRLDCNTLGLFARMRTPEGLTHIMPYAIGQDKYYMSFYRSDYISEEAIDKKCGVEGHESHNFENPINADEIRENLDATNPFIEKRVNGTVVQRTYRIAIASTAEYTNQIGSVSAMMSRMVTGVNTINAIYERELAVDFKLVDNNEVLIQTDTNNQPYTDVHLGRTVLGQNHGVLVDLIGVDAFDIGHVFTIPCTDGILGVAALGSLCNDMNKGTGVTCGYTSDIILMVSETMAHEVGHQFAASHSWHYCSPDDLSDPDDDPDRDENRSATTAFEPGSGSTIMSYAGVCDAGQNVKFTNDTYFHVGNLLQIANNQNNDNVATCGDIRNIDNDLPLVSLPYQSGFSIPSMTPFMLTADATDPNGDELAYCWEQLNRVFEEYPLGTQFGDSPAFRSFPPALNKPTRVFPNLTSIVLNNTFDLDDELLADYSRNYKFRCSVRDNLNGVSGVVWSEELSFEVSGSAGPFVVSGPNLGTEDWNVGSYVEVTWDVANTDKSPVNCKFVDILLSTDNGFNYPITLATNVPNDGSHNVVVPNAESDVARVMIKAADNIFFDISDKNFTISPPTQPGYIFDAGPYSQQVCLPTDVTVDILTESLLGYDSLLTFSIEGLPMGAIANFSKNPARPSENVTLTIDMNSVSFTGISDITVSAEGPNIPKTDRLIVMDFVDTDFSALALSTPMENATSVADVPSFSWSALPNADSYTIEIATNPAFGASIVETASDITSTTYLPNIVLDKSTIYYWRVYASNACGDGAPTAISVFQTETLSCSKSSTGLIEEPIPVQSGQTVISKFNISNGGSIVDLNVSKVDLNYNPIGAIKLELESPSGKKVVLIDGRCSTFSGMNISFDSDANNPIGCPLNNGATVRPEEDLSIFNNEISTGEWIMTVTVLEAGFGVGKLNEWELEICANSSVSGPSLITNEELPVRTNDGQWISNLFLRATDPDQPASELVYVIVENPEYGHLEDANMTQLNVGDTFTQGDINNKRIIYFHDGAAVSSDMFYFTLSDEQGGFIGKTAFAIGIDDTNPPVSTFEPLDLAWNLFPNPAKDQITLTLGAAADKNLQVNIINIQGRLIESHQVAKGQQQLSLEASQWPVGMYFVEMTDGQAISTEKVVIQR